MNLKKKKTQKTSKKLIMQLRFVTSHRKNRVGKHILFSFSAFFFLGIICISLGRHFRVWSTPPPSGRGKFGGGRGEKEDQEERKKNEGDPSSLWRYTVGLWIWVWVWKGIGIGIYLLESVGLLFTYIFFLMLPISFVAST